MASKQDVIKELARRELQKRQQPQRSQVSPLDEIRSMAQGGTLGFSDEIAAGLLAAGVSAKDLVTQGKNPVSTFKEEFPLMADSIRERQDNFNDENKAASLALEGAGGLVSGSLAGKLVKETVKQGAKQSAKLGFGTGALAGAGFSDSDELLSIDTGIDAAMGGVLGAGLGAAIPTVSEKVKKELRKLANKGIKIQDDAYNYTPQAKEILIREGIPEENIVRAELFAKRNIPATRADITQNLDDFAQQQSLAKKSGPFSQALADQEKAIINLARDGVENLKPASSNIIETNSRVFNVVSDVVSSLDEEVSKAYQLASQRATGQDFVSLDKLAKAISDNRGNERISGGIVSAAKQLLQNKGLLRAGNQIDINKRGPRVAGLKKITVKEAEEIRQGLNSLFEGANPQGRILIRRLKDAIDDDVEKVAGEDIFKPAREAKIRFQKVIERNRRDKFDKTRRGFLEDVINNKISEEQITTKLLSGRDDDFIKFKNFLLNDAGANGVQAFNDIKAEVLRGAINKAVSTQAKAQGGGAVFNARLFKNEINKLKRTNKFNELFNADEKELIEDIIEIGRLRVPQGGVQQGKGPTELAVEEARRGIVKSIPFVGESARGLIDSISTSKQVKKALNPQDEFKAILGK